MLSSPSWEQNTEIVFFPYMTRLWNRLPKDVKIKSVDEFKLYIQKEVKPKRYKFYAKGQKYKCSLLTRIRVGRSLLKEHSFSIGLSDTMSCPKCDHIRESPIHFITTCPFFTEQREIMFTKMLQFIPATLLAHLRRHFAMSRFFLSHQMC